MAAMTGDGSSQAASSRAAAASRATRLSASRWRTAWKLPIGRPNCIRSSEWVRASSSIVRPAPTSSWPSGELPQGGRRRPVGRLRAARPCRLEFAAGPRTARAPDRGPAPAGVSAGPDRRRRWRGHRRSAATTSAVSPRSSAAVPEPFHDAPFPSQAPWGVAVAQRGGRTTPTPVVGVQSARPAANRARPRWSPPLPGNRRAPRRQSGGRRGQRVAPAEVVEGSVERRTSGCFRGVAHPALEERALRRLHQLSAPMSRRRRAMMLRWISALPP